MWYRSIAGLEPDSTARQGLDKNIENNPMQSSLDPGAQHFCRAASGAGEEKSNPASYHI
jgi:hypothetical protein